MRVNRLLGGEKNALQKKIFQEIMAENSPNLVKDTAYRFKKFSKPHIGEI